MARTEDGFFTARDRLRLYWTSLLPEQPRAHLAVVHGYGDHIGRYRSTFEALAAQGLGVHGFDYRGHGRADGRRAYCQAWTDYLDDLELFWERTHKAAADKPLFLLAHSHGALMAVHLLARGGLQGLAGLVLSAPYFRLAFTPPPLKFLAARGVGRLIPWLPIKTELTPQDLTHDEAVQRATWEDPLYNRTVTPRWFVESTRAQGEVLALASRVQRPALFFMGAEDRVACLRTAKAFFQAVPAQDKSFKEYPGMRHEPLNERGREQVHQDIAGWISAHL